MHPVLPAYTFRTDQHQNLHLVQLREGTERKHILRPANVAHRWRDVQFPPIRLHAKPGADAIVRGTEV
jgi:hypothetical protein